MGSYSVHKCDPEGAPLSALDGPAYALTGDAVRLPEENTFGRVRLIWRCCGAFLVECLREPDNAECADTYTMRVRAGQLAPIPSRMAFSVPCVGAEWSLTLSCGHITGEGCDCDTIAAEADGQD